MRVEGWRSSLFQGTEPEGPDVEVFSSVVNESLGSLVRKTKILDNETCRFTATVESAVQHACVQKIVEEPAEELGERNALEIGECSCSNPETTSVVTEEVLSERDVINGRRRGRFGGDSGTSRGNITSAILDMEVVPRIPSTTEGLGLDIGGLIISQGTSNDNTMVLGEEDAVNVVVGRVLGFGADTGNSFGDAAGSVVCRLDELLSFL